MAVAAASRSLRHRTPLRTQLIVVTVALAALAVVAVAVGSTWVLRSYLYGQVDEQLTRSVAPLTSGTVDGPRTPPSRGRGGFVPPVAFFGQVYDERGDAIADLGSSLPESTERPALPVLDAATVASLAGDPFTVQGDGGSWRVLVAAVENPRTPDIASVAVAVPLDGVQSTVARLLLVDGVVAVVVLVVLALVARWVVAASLRPLSEIEQTAHSIAAGDLARRVDNDIPDTEVGRLGASLNVMLDTIETAFSAQEGSERAARASEEQMRRLVADASHELRTPLTTIRGYAELYRQGAMPEDLSAAQVMERIEGTAERMGVLIDDLLLLARLDQHRTLSREPVDVLAVASDVVREFALMADGHRLDVVADGTEPAIVVGDPDRLRQVVSNLVANAIRHTPTGTCVTVSVNVVADDVLLEVSDDGPGMGEESAARAFERFYRADSARSREGDVSGSGLGLAIVQAIAQAHGGRATIRSEPGVGTVVSVRLPRLAA
ncbi:MAG TPA: HAMP domain-containing sensor histidine kinase [Actinomycetes bacterium]|nr:HAMP domain-containing sensor histidine kinase [Actinomycetes bacterium]